MKEGIKLQKEVFWAWLAQVPPEVADKYWEADDICPEMLKVLFTGAIHRSHLVLI